jgi:hypothetical protein
MCASSHLSPELPPSYEIACETNGRRLCRLSCGDAAHLFAGLFQPAPHQRARPCHRRAHTHTRRQTKVRGPCAAWPRRSGPSLRTLLSAPSALDDTVRHSAQHCRYARSGTDDPACASVRTASWSVMATHRVHLMQINASRRPLQLTGAVKRCLNLGSYNYLGFAAADDYCTPRVLTCVRDLGWSSCGSRDAAGAPCLRIVAAGQPSRLRRALMLQHEAGHRVRRSHRRLQETRLSVMFV